MRGRRSLILVALAAGLLLALELRHLAASGAYSGTARPGVCRVVTERRLVALTFDDGPSEAYTEHVLRLLEADGAAATFFLVGRNVAAAPGIVRREAAGMELGNHTWSHARLPGLGIEQVRDQILRTQAALDSQNVTAALFRAPLGLATPDQLSFVRSLGLRPVHWSIALDHYVGGIGLDAAGAASRLLQDLRPGDILLAHDGGGDRAEAMAALELLLPELQRGGWEVTTVGHLLSQGEPIFAAPRPWFWQSGFYCP
ncbi:MAG: polysaccharide deacetylase family protein [Actinomycetota bacterium]